ncbi:MAG: hypothetical protein JWO32_2398 [Bacteroidetes bacterium]|nr:hypothetical protein [Bacteroidota bacterium]
MFTISGKIIFISPIDWGMGHATRCVPIIAQLKKNNRIVIGTTSSTEKIFNDEFPELQKIDVPAYNIRYSSVFPLWLKLIIDWPRISLVKKKEKACLERIISSHNIDLVISDNRFGLYSKKIHSVFITHQLFLKTPFANSIAQKLNKKYILNFDEVWVPDFESAEINLSGELSHGTSYHKNVTYLGPQSRLNKAFQISYAFDYLILLSGPEPQQSILRNVLIKKTQGYPHLKFALVSSGKKQTVPKNIMQFISPGASQLSELISGSKKIICRSGYSSLMDLHALNKKEIILIPTPGQTEQEYLAYYWHKKFGAEILFQKEINSFELK